MVDRLRAFLDRPLDRSAARAVVVLATAIFAGFVTVVLLARAGHHPAIVVPTRPRSQPPTTPPGPVSASSGAHRTSARPTRRQDPQDIAGSAAARRAAQELGAHRALQHVPYRHGTLRIEIVGADRGRLVLRVVAPSIASARAGWRRFLRRYRDPGEAYRVRFVAEHAEQRGIETQRGSDGAVVSPVASPDASPVASPVAISFRKRCLNRRHGSDRGGAILPTSISLIEENS
jgi:hypothetical protein